MITWMRCAGGGVQFLRKYSVAVMGSLLCETWCGEVSWLLSSSGNGSSIKPWKITLMVVSGIKNEYEDG